MVVSECVHEAGWLYERQGYQLDAGSPEAVPEGVELCWCASCGELRFFEDGKWAPRYWTKEEIDEIEKEAARLTEWFNKNTF